MSTVLFDATGSTDPEAIRKASLEIDIPPQTTPTGWGVKFDPATGQNVKGFFTANQWEKGEKMFNELAEKRRSVKIYAERPVEAQKLDAIIEAALSPGRAGAGDLLTRSPDRAAG